MKTAEEWALECWTVTNIEVARSRMASVIADAQRESAEKMREQFKRLARMKFSGWRGLAEVLTAIDALPLPGDET